MNWNKYLQESVTAIEDLPANFKEAINYNKDELKQYPMRINRYYLSLIKEPGDPIWLQSIPNQLEVLDDVCFEDSLAEEELSPVENLIHKYPDRVLFLVNNQCAMYCRFCTRKRKVGTSRMVITDQTIQEGINYIKKTPAIRDVLVSGGDPLLLTDEKLDWILHSIREIKHVEIIRIGSRVPCVFPMRVTNNLIKVLKKYHPLYINTHFNHPSEITEQSSQSCQKLVDAGIPMGCQTVLLKGVNDSPVIMKKLMHELLKIRVKPYYIFQGDMTQGTNHFRTSIQTGLEIMQSLIGHTSGLAVPAFAIDAPGGGGKIRLLPDNIIKKGKELVFENYKGVICSYLDC